MVIDKNWHAIHYILCDSAWGGESPLCNVVLGGEGFDNTDLGYGPLRYLTEEEVKEVHIALEEIPESIVKDKFDCNKFNEYEIYPGFSDEEKDEDIEWITTSYKEIKDFFKRAVENKKLIFLYID